MFMKTWSEKDVENLIRNSEFSNPAHKKALREKLFTEDLQLGLDDLDMVAGGKSIAEQEKWEIWPVPDND